MPRLPKQAIMKTSVVKLPRSIISVQGIDAASVLQGLTTNHVMQFLQDTHKQALYTCFLNTQGRIFQDAFLIKPKISLDGKWVPKDKEIWIDTHSGMADEMMTHIKKYLIRKKVMLHNLGDQLSVYALLSQQIKVDVKEGEEIQLEFDVEPEENDLYKSLCFADPRSTALGLRTVSGNPIQYDKELTKGNMEEYKAFRLAHGVLEGEEMKNKIPFLVNCDLFNGIHFSKGCYVGQELTARSYHTGIVRKRCMPFIIGEAQEWNLRYQEDLINQSVKNQKDELLGKVVSQQNNIFVASVNYLDYEVKDLNVDGKPVRLIQNPYLMEKLYEYKQYVQNRI